jgi:hypothetical protein
VIDPPACGRSDRRAPTTSSATVREREAGSMSTSGSTMTIRQAAFIGVGAMVGAGIFALLGEAGAVHGSAVWISFVLAGVIAGFHGYSFARLGARYPSSGGLLEYLARGFGDGHVTAPAAGRCGRRVGFVEARSRRLDPAASSFTVTTEGSDGPA